MISIGVCFGINYGLGEKGREVAPVVNVRGDVWESCNESVLIVGWEIGCVLGK